MAKENPNFWCESVSSCVGGSLSLYRKMAGLKKEEGNPDMPVFKDWSVDEFILGGMKESQAKQQNEISIASLRMALPESKLKVDSRPCTPEWLKDLALLKIKGIDQKHKPYDKLSLIVLWQ